MIQDGIDISVGDVGVLGGKNVVGSVPDHGQHLVLVESHSLLVDQSALLNDKSIELQLHVSPLDDPLLDGVLGDEPE